MYLLLCLSFSKRFNIQKGELFVGIDGIAQVVHNISYIQYCIYIPGIFIIW